MKVIEQDTIKLLRECDAGIRMGVDSIEDVLPHVKSEKFRESLTKCRDQHENLRDEVEKLLHKYKDEGKEPSPIAKGMSWMKTNVKMGLEDTDKTVADLMTDGCNMGVKSLGRYLNQYEAAEEFVKDIAKRLISLEKELTDEIRQYL